MTVPAGEPSEIVGDLAHDTFMAAAWRASSDGLALIECNGTIIESNEAFDRLVGRDAASLDVCEVFAPDEVVPVLRDCDPTKRSSVAGLGADGFPFLAEMTATPVEGDLTLISARTRLPSVTKQAATSGVAHEELAHALSHDVRGRLRGVAGFVGMVADQHGGGIEPAGLELLERAAAAGRAADSMLDRLVRYLRLGDRSFVLAPEPLDTIIAEAESACGGIDISSSQRLPVVFADRSLLVDALAEIFGNAAEYADGGEPPVVTLSWRESSGWCELRIDDDGPGIPPELIADSFGIFRQLQARNWERGVGMGLPICRRILDGHGGRVAIESDGRAGTAVLLRLALAPDGESQGRDRPIDALI